MSHTRITLRIPEHLAEWLKAQAEKNHRSLNSEIIARIEKEKRKCSDKP